MKDSLRESGSLKESFTASEEAVVKRWITLACGVVLVLVGAVWVLQGVGVLTGSFMTGQKLWFLIGLVAFLVGVVLVSATAFRKRAR